MILVTGLLFVMTLGALSIMTVVGNSMTMAQRREQNTEAFNMADSGVDLAKAWLGQQSAPPAESALQPLNNFFGSTGTISNPFGTSPGSSLTVRIDAGSTNTSATQKHYLVESQAVLANGVTATVRAYLQQASFGKYAYFTVNDGGGFWDFNNHFEGPFHSNDADGLQSMFLWNSSYQTNPIFTYTGNDAFSVSGNVTWWKNTIGNTVPPSTVSDFKAVASGGQATMTYGYKTDANGNYLLDGMGNKIPNSSAIPLPTTSYAQQYATLGLPIPATPPTTPSSAAPTHAGVTFVHGGGLYIHGDNQMALSVDSSGRQVITVTQGTTVQTVTVDLAANDTITTTQVGSKSTSVTSASVPNGLIYSDGNITSLHGTIANNVVSGGTTIPNAWTIATDVAAGKNVTLSGSIKYLTPRNLSVPESADTNFVTNAGLLGILSNHVGVASGAGPNLEFDGSIFAAQTFDALDPTSPSGSTGTMLSIGGVITQNAGVFAYADSSGNLTSGYQEQYHYDTRLANTPPPFFPTTGSHYDVVSWQRKQVLLN